MSDGSYDDYISLTDIAKYKSEDSAATIQNWMRSRDVIEFLGLWETLHNPDFKPLEFEGLSHGPVLMRYRDIAFEFASWISAEFKLYITTDYQRLKTDENSRLSLNWNMNCEISKINYRIHTNAINAEMIKQGIVRNDWLVELNRIAKTRCRLY